MPNLSASYRKLLLALFLTASSGCAPANRTNPSALPSTAPITLPPASAAPALKILSAPTEAELDDLGKSGLPEANTRFGMKLLAQLLKANAGKNLFISPVSAAIALGMTYNGAEKETQEAMAKALELQGMDRAKVNQAQLVLRKRLANPATGVKLTLANSLWAKKGQNFIPEFLKTNQNFFGAEVNTLEFSDPKAPTVINDWVNSNTGGKIKQVIQEIEPLTILLLINAIYFNGQWTQPFDTNLTEERNFNLLNSTKKRVMMMSRSANFRYYRNSERQVQAIALPYGADEKINMYVFLPDADAKLDTFLQSFTAENWQQWQKEFQLNAGDVVLPKFKLEFDLSFNDALKALGMGVAFEEGKANFNSLITKTDAYISKVKQNTFIEVNERGTEAAAATTVVVKTKGAVRPPGEPFTFIADHPFVFVLHDERTKTILFTGVVVEP